MLLIIRDAERRWMYYHAERGNNIKCKKRGGWVAIALIHRLH